MSNKLVEVLDELDEGVMTYSRQAIDEDGGDYKDLAITYCRGGADNNQLRQRNWLVTYSNNDYTTTAATISELTKTTVGNLQVVFGLPGKAARDDTTVRSDRKSNWGSNNPFRLMTRESERRREAQACRRVANKFSELMIDVFSSCSMVVDQFDVTENNPHQVLQDFIWFPSTVSIGWSLTWSTDGDTA